MLLNKLMNALQKAMERESASRESSVESRPFGQLAPQRHEDVSSSDQSDSQLLAAVTMPLVSRASPVDLQRRAGVDGKVFWKCYFNVVSCF